MRANRFLNAVRYIYELLILRIIRQRIHKGERDLCSCRKVRLEGHKAFEQLAKIKRPLTAAFFSRDHRLYLQFLQYPQLLFLCFRQWDIALQDDGIFIRVIFPLPKETVKDLTPVNSVFFYIRAIVAPRFIRADHNDRFLCCFFLLLRFLNSLFFLLLRFFDSLFCDSLFRCLFLCTSLFLCTRQNNWYRDHTFCAFSLYFSFRFNFCCFLFRNIFLGLSFQLLFSNRFFWSLSFRLRFYGFFQ